MTDEYHQADKERRRKEKAFAKELETLFVKHGARLHNDGAAGMWIEFEADEPGSEWCP